MTKSREKLAYSQKMEALGLLAGGVAHDLNNVMFGLVSYPDFLLTKMAPDDPLYAPLKNQYMSPVRLQCQIGPSSACLNTSFERL